MVVEKLYEDSETGCCKRFNPEPWEDKEIVFDKKLFLKDTIPCLFHIPLNFGKAMTRNMEIIKNAGALADEPLMLYGSQSMFRGDLFIAVSKEVPNVEMVRLSGMFLTKVFEGEFGESGRWIKEMDRFVGSRNKETKKLYFYYTTCPACAKAYGKNYTVLLAEI